MEEQLKELEKEKARQAALWANGEMTHTTENITRSELRQRGAVHQGFMASMIRKGQGATTAPIQPVVQRAPVPQAQNTRQQMFNNGMMFGRFR